MTKRKTPPPTAQRAETPNPDAVLADMRKADEAAHDDRIAQRVLDAMTAGSTRVPLIEWEFRYKISTGLVTTRIRTFTEQEAEARALAFKYLEQEVQMPNVRFVYVKLACVATSAKYAEIASRFSKVDALKLPDPVPPVAAAAPPPPRVEPTAELGAAAPPTTEQLLAARGIAAPATATAGLAPNPPGFEGMDDGMSGPPVAADQVRRGRIGA